MRVSVIVFMVGERTNAISRFWCSTLERGSLLDRANCCNYQLSRLSRRCKSDRRIDVLDLLLVASSYQHDVYSCFVQKAYVLFCGVHITHHYYK
jgi:hypothetical protein